MAVNRHLLPFAVTSLGMALFCARSAAQIPAGPSAFDVASIHVNNTETGGHHHIFNDPGESHFRTQNLSLRSRDRHRQRRDAFGKLATRLQADGGC